MNFIKYIWKVVNYRIYMNLGLPSYTIEISRKGHFYPLFPPPKVIWRSNK